MKHLGRLTGSLRLKFSAIGEVSWTTRSFACVVTTLLILKWFLASWLLPASLVVAPDEGAYVQLINWIAEGGDWRTWREGSGAKFMPSGLALLGPATVLHTLGLEPLLSLRSVAGIYSLLSLGVVFAILRQVQVREGRSGRSRIYVWQGFWIVIWLFLPSNALWTVLGLKESALQFYLSLSVWAVLNLVREIGDARKTLVSSFALMVGLLGLNFSRNFVGLLFALAVVLACVVYISLLRHVALLVAVLVTVTTICGFFLSRPYTEPPNPSVRPALESQSEDVEARVIEVQQPALDSVARVSPTLSLHESVRGLLAWPGERRDALRDGAASQVPRASCEAFSGDADVLSCEVRRLPVATLWVLASPNPLSGPAPTSTLAQVASLENLAWLVLVAVLALTVRLTKVTDQISARLVSTAMWILLSTSLVALAVVGGNLGTSFRQKSVLLVIVVLLAVVRVPRGSPDLRES